MPSRFVHNVPIVQQLLGMTALLFSIQVRSQMSFVPQPANLLTGPPYKYEKVISVVYRV